MALFHVLILILIVDKCYSNVLRSWDWYCTLGGPMTQCEVHLDTIPHWWIILKCFRVLISLLISRWCCSTFLRACYWYSSLRGSMRHTEEVHLLWQRFNIGGALWRGFMYWFLPGLLIGAIQTFSEHGIDTVAWEDPWYNSRKSICFDKDSTLMGHYGMVSCIIFYLDCW